MRWIEVLFPKRCIACKKRGSLICALCQSVLTRTQKRLYGIITIYNYSDPHVQTLIKHIKEYRDQGLIQQLALPLGGELLEHIEYYVATKAIKDIALVPIPPSKRRIAEFGFSQTHEITRILRCEIYEATIIDLLIKNRETAKQALLNKSNRITNISGALSVSNKYEKSIHSDTLYIIVDDVTTTGATLLEARRALTEAGARNIILCALAHQEIMKDPVV